LLAHHLGHVFGAKDDGAMDLCGRRNEIMTVSPAETFRNKSAWSLCAVRTVNAFLCGHYSNPNFCRQDLLGTYVNWASGAAGPFRAWRLVASVGSVAALISTLYWLT